MLTGEFRKLWIGQSISAIGSSVTFVAILATVPVAAFAAVLASSTPSSPRFHDDGPC